MTANFRTFIIGASPRGKRAMTEKLKSISKTISVAFVAVVHSFFVVPTVSSEILTLKNETSDIDILPCHVGDQLTQDVLIKGQNHSLQEALRLAMRFIGEFKFILE